MVFKLDPQKRLIADDGQPPVNNISFARFWVQITPAIFAANQDLITTHYTGDDENLPSFDPERPYNLPLKRFSADGVLLAPSITYALGNHEGFVRHLIVTWAAQTGDIPHVAAAVALDHLADVIIIFDPALETQGEAAYDTYMQASFSSRGPERDYERLMKPFDVGEGRLKLAEMLKEQTYIVYNGLRPRPPLEIGISSWHSNGDENVRDLFANNKDGGRVEYPVVTVVGTTTFIANTYRTYEYGHEAFYTFLADALSSPAVPQDAVAEWAALKFGESLPLPPPPPSGGAQRMKILLLWSRYSGQNTPDGYNPAGDSDPVGQRQLIDMGTRLGFTVITIGHDSTWSPTPNPHAEIHFGEFWKDPPFKKKERPVQTTVYVSLVRNHNVVQIGQKTGGMDNAALVGVPTVYIEDVGSPSKSRMATWTRDMKRYKGAIVQNAPTALGKALRLFPRNRPLAEQWVREGRVQPGYDPNDLPLIEDTLAAMFATIYPEGGQPQFK
ncbi:hypothetical protein PHLCEN_2v7975 [Hermanssonia centrifuga]|uniref:Uncharacterized protein n=1 Tax=Hermanssonia centrifuga TaxID=98765 RepID=A0A2R6NV06_9APHY|nr:hypothetical protein PHLCEN_2v7975 [Hermanssonia centrifuga]